MGWDLKVMRRGVTVVVGVIVLVASSGCSMIPYETPEARNQIQHDLKLAPGDIQAISETNWCFHPYGSEPFCTVTKGLGVLTGNGLILSLYKNKSYTEVTLITREQVLCAKATNGREVSEPFMVFTQDKAIMLAPITPGGQMNAGPRLKFFDYLLSRNQTVFKNAEGDFIRKTDKTRTVGGMIAGTSIPWHSQVDVLEMANPCLEPAKGQD